ncbi:MAG: ABC transporter ATP-binding protein, partial [Clostridia bacterium]|nr:ABC transporter ATP-binding protein [Clostridia bacterium]
MALIGPNGAGKTTLLLHFNGLLTPTEGHILWEGRAVAAPGFDRAAWRRQVGFIFQSPCHQLFGETVAAEVAFGLRQLKLAPAEIAVRTREAMAAVGLVDAALLARSPFTLSYGEQRRVALAAVLAMRPRLLVLDEATAGLDARATQDLLALLDRLAERGTAVILA